MYLKPADPDLQTLYHRIRSGDLDLQPEFQRGEVWSDLKRQRLIDSILREWQVPPVHVVVDAETSKQSVLDGQQRLAAIRDFFDGSVRINGQIEPADPAIQRLHGLTFEQLPPDVRRKLERYSIRVFYISDYSPEEPGELFFRLNQNSALSPAEQRNAFFGRARRQVKTFVQAIESSDLRRAYFGFTNARMAYDDIIARSLLILEAGTFSQKVTSAKLVDRYRSDDGFSDDAQRWLREGLNLMEAASPSLCTQIRLNKATALTWMIFSSRVAKHSERVNPKIYGDFLSQFEVLRAGRGHTSAMSTWSEQALATYDDRASARVGDVSSVTLRDFVLWLHFVSYNKAQGSGGFFVPFAASEWSQKVLHLVEEGFDVEKVAAKLDWGSQL